MGLLAWGGGGLILGALNLLRAEHLLWMAGLSLWMGPSSRSKGSDDARHHRRRLVLLPAAVSIVDGRPNTDELYLHLGLPLQMLMEEGLLGGPLPQRESSAHLDHGLCDRAGVLHRPGSRSAALVAGRQRHCADGADREGALERASVGLLAAIVLAQSTTFASASAHAGSDIPAAFAVLIAMDAARRGHVGSAGFAAGLALSIKYTAWAPLLGAWLLMNGRPLG